MYSFCLSFSLLFSCSFESIRHFRGHTLTRSLQMKNEGQRSQNPQKLACFFNRLMRACCIDCLSLLRVFFFGQRKKGKWRMRDESQKEAFLAEKWPKSGPSWSLRRFINAPNGHKRSVVVVGQRKGLFFSCRITQLGIMVGVQWRQIRSVHLTIQWLPLNMATSGQAKNGRNNRRPALSGVFI